MQIFEIINKGVGTYGLDGTALTVNDLLLIEDDPIGGTVESVVAGTGVTVDNTDPANPIVSADGSAFTNLTGVELIDEGGGATYGYTGSPNFFRLISYGGRSFIQIEMSNISTTGTPTGTLRINFVGASINTNYIGAMVESISGSDMTDVESRIPVPGTSNSNIRLALKSNRNSFASAVTFTSGWIRLIIPAD